MLPRLHRHRMLPKSMLASECALVDRGPTVAKSAVSRLVRMLLHNCRKKTSYYTSPVNTIVCSFIFFFKFIFERFGLLSIRLLQVANLDALTGVLIMEPALPRASYAAGFSIDELQKALRCTSSI